MKLDRVRKKYDFKLGQGKNKQVLSENMYRKEVDFHDGQL